MKLYLLTQDVVDGWDTFDSCVVAAENEEDAKTIHPYDGQFVHEFHDGKWWGKYTGGDRIGEEYEFDSDTWPSTPEPVKVHYLGEAKEGIERGVICSSFNAG